MGITGCFLVGQKLRYGWLVFAIASGINVYIGIKAGIIPMAIASVFYLCLEIKGWIQHHRHHVEE